MLRKHIISSAVAVAALSLSAGAFASENAGFVIGAQGGYGDTHWSNIDYTSTIGHQVVLTQSVSDGGFAARAFAGYDFNKYFGLEAGYTYLPTSQYTVTIPHVSSSTTDINSYGLDLLGKLSVPVTPTFRVYAKAGLGYLHASFANNVTFNGENTHSHFGPAYGVGASYEVVPNLAIDASWLRYSGQGDFDSGNYIPNADVGLIGLSYKFPVNFS